MEPIKALFFDAVGTLFKVRGTVGGIYAEVAGRYGVHASAPELDEGFKRGFKKIDRLVYENFPREQWDQAEREWWFHLVHEVFSGLNRIPEPYETYFEDVYRTFQDPRSWEIYPDVLEHLTILKKRGYIIGIISNFDRRIFPICNGLGLTECVDSIHLPRDVGAAKPDPRIFQAALTQHQLLPHQAVHIGDHPVEDVDGAKLAGLIPVLIERNGSQNGSEVVRSLRDLVLWIERM